ncbi:tetratricopeptide repeat protein [Candidatus Cyanaurora vandensis]|uniref:tetratricopeptide repeat protein n=1 Tax=Candidatus Cyanaurora vandensis TaxID=2714958 RepID=UPI00257B6261|nr:tetratricopeptide repeat protein [Candidatus Cyanaurora vandensis]
MSVIRLILGVMVVGITLPALAQTTDQDTLQISVGVQEERPQFLPDSAKLVVPQQIQQLEQQSKADPKNVDLKFDLLMAYSRTSLLDRAWPVALDIDKLSPEYTLKILQDTEAQIKKNPKDQEARYRAAMASFARGLQLKELAREKYMEPLQRGQTIPDGWWDDFRAYLKNGDKEAAKRLNNLEVVTMLDEVRSRRGNAETQLQTILTQDKNQTWAQNYLAFLNYDRGDMKQAESLIRESLTTDPSNPLSHFALAQLYFKQGQLKEAVAAMKMAFQLRAQGK